MEPLFSLEDLENERGDPIEWFSTQLAHFNVEHHHQPSSSCSDDNNIRDSLSTEVQKLQSSSFLLSPQLDGFLQSIYGALDLRLSQLNQSEEQAEDSLFEGAATIKTDTLEIVTDIKKCRLQLQRLRSQLQAVGSDQLSSLKTLSEIDCLKKRLATCKNVLTELHQWDFKVRELELLLKTLHSTDDPSSLSNITPIYGRKLSNLSTGGNLTQAIGQLTSMKEAAKALEGIPRFSGKLRWIAAFEERILVACRDRLPALINSMDSLEFHQYHQTFVKLGAESDFVMSVVFAFKGIAIDIFNRLWRETRFMSSTARAHDSSGLNPPSSLEGDIEDDKLQTSVFKPTSERDMLLNYFKSITSKFDAFSQMVSTLTPGLPKNELERLVLHILTEILSIPTKHINQYLHSAEANAELEAEEAQIANILEIGYSILCAVGLVGEVEQYYNAHTESNRHEATAESNNMSAKSSLLITEGPKLNYEIIKHTSLKCNGNVMDNTISHFWKTFYKHATSQIWPTALTEVPIAKLSTKLNALMSSGPTLNSSWSPSQMVLEIESEVVRVLRALPITVLHSGFSSIDFGGASNMEIPSTGLFCASLALETLLVVDHYLTQYWKKWNNLFTLFENTVKTKSAKLLGGQDPSDPSQLFFDISIVGPVCQLTQTINTTCRASLKRVGETLWGPIYTSWVRASRFNRVSRYAALEVPSKEKSRKIVIDALESWQPQFTMPTAESIPPIETILPCSNECCEELLNESYKLLILCVTYPIKPILQAYINQSIWISTIPPKLSDISPSLYVTSIGEYCLAAVPHLLSIEKHEDTSNKHNYNMKIECPSIKPIIDKETTAMVSILENVLIEGSKLFTSAVLKIETFSIFGLCQLEADARYLARAYVALGGNTTTITNIADCASTFCNKFGTQYDSTGVCDQLFNSSTIFTSISQQQ